MLRSCAAIAASFLISHAAFASEIKPVSLPPIDHTEAMLTVVSPDGRERTFTPATIEALPTYRLKTTTPWREVPASFDGVMLRDLLRETGLADAGAILVTAENEFTSTIPRSVWEETDMLVVTRVDGAPHSRRARGPIQFVVDAGTYANSGLVSESHLVWMAARIEAAE